MKGNDDVVIYSNEKEKARSLVNNSSIIFCLDFNNLSRINELGELINLSKSVKVLIDHHLDPVKFYDIAYHNSNASATAELIYELIEMINIDFLDKDRPLYSDHNTMKKIVKSCKILYKVELSLGNLYSNNNE